MSFLNEQNYRKGFLIDGECIGGITVSETPAGLSVENAKIVPADQDGLEASTSTPEANSKRRYHAYAANYLTSETVFSRTFDSLQSALDFINAQQREWIYESLGCTKISASAHASAENAAEQSCGSQSCGSGMCH